MKKKYLRMVAICCLVLSYSFWACTGDQKKEPPPNSIAPTDTLAASTDTLIQGAIPEGWYKVGLEHGFYIAFPKKPQIRQDDRANRMRYKLEKKRYTAFLSMAHMDNDSLFLANKDKLGRYYDAVLQDFLEDTTIHLQSQETFYFDNVYQGLQASFLVDTSDIWYTAFMAVDNTLFTVSFAHNQKEEEDLPALQQQFFNSFGYTGTLQ